MNAFVTKNLWDYEEINPVPEIISEMDTFYITDSYENRRDAILKGWKFAFDIQQFRNETDLLKRRSIIGSINAFPERIIIELNDYDRIFVIDSNLITLPSNYLDFIEQSKNEACYLTSGYYKEPDDTIYKELARSIHSRWNYNANAMVEATDDYCKKLIYKGIRPYEVSISSAKYIGWNLKHSKRQEIGQFVFDEYQKHLQGNIIFTFVSAFWKDYVFNFRTLNDDVNFSPHKFVA